jgi:hypothetical protein
VLLFELLTGTKLLDGEQRAARGLHDASQHPAAAGRHGADATSGRFEDVVTHALAKDREHRFSTAGAFANALAAALPAYRPSADLMARSTRHRRDHAACRG